MRDQPLAEEMRIVVLGTGDAVQARDFEEIRARFAGSLMPMGSVSADARKLRDDFALPFVE